MHTRQQQQTVHKNCTDEQMISASALSADKPLQKLTDPNPNCLLILHSASEVMT